MAERYVYGPACQGEGDCWERAPAEGWESLVQADPPYRPQIAPADIQWLPCSDLTAKDEQPDPAWPAMPTTCADGVWTADAPGDGRACLLTWSHPKLPAHAYRLVIECTLTTPNSYTKTGWSLRTIVDEETICYVPSPWNAASNQGTYYCDLTCRGDWTLTALVRSWQHDAGQMHTRVGIQAI